MLIGFICKVPTNNAEDLIIILNCIKHYWRTHYHAHPLRIPIIHLEVFVQSIGRCPCDWFANTSKLIEQKGKIAGADMSFLLLSLRPVFPCDSAEKAKMCHKMLLIRPVSTSNGFRWWTAFNLLAMQQQQSYAVEK